MLNEEAKEVTKEKEAVKKTHGQKTEVHEVIEEETQEFQCGTLAV